MLPGTTSAKSTRHKSCGSQSLPSPVLGVQNEESEAKHGPEQLGQIKKK